MKQANILTILSIALFASMAYGQQERSFEQTKSLEIFNSLYREVDLFYVDTIQPDKFIRTGIDAMLNSLDPYSEYMEENETDDLMYITTGEYGGIGAGVMFRDGKVFIPEVFEGTPAAEAGLLPGDIIIKVDTTKVSGFTVSQVSNLLKGQANTPIRVEVERPGTEGTLVKEFYRRKIVVNTVPYWGVVGTNTGYIRLTNFTDKSAQEVKSAFLDLRENKKIQSLVLDLRDNPGGVMESAIQIVNFFVPKGSPILTTKGKTRQADREYRATLDPLDLKIPIVVLINSGSASASEILSGALQDLDRAVLIGTRSFGKGLVQSPRSLPYNGLLKLTTAKYYIPSGRCIQAIDYSHRNEDGSVGSVPDSLTKEFTTSKGRIVRDGGGVTPDRLVEPERSPNILFYLVRDFLTHDYVTEFGLKHPTIAPAGEFELTDEQYRDFIELVKNHNFTYDRQSERLLKDLRRMMEFEGYYENAKEEFDNLEAKLNHNVERDLETFKPQIKQLLEELICKRYYREKGEVQQALKENKEVSIAVELLSKPNEYSSLLSPKKK